MCLPPGMFERPPNGTIVQINTASEKTRLTAKGQPRLLHVELSRTMSSHVAAAHRFRRLRVLHK